MARAISDEELVGYARLALAVMNDLKSIGLPLLKVSKLEYNPNLKRVVARCCTVGRAKGNEIIEVKKIWIEISESFTHFSTEEQRSILAHEFIHACGVRNHGDKFKYYMNIVNRHGYNVTIKADSYPIELYKYIIACPKCGQHWGFHRMCDSVENCTDYLCSQCKCKLVRVK